MLLIGFPAFATAGCFGAIQRADFDRVVAERGGGLTSAGLAGSLAAISESLADETSTGDAMSPAHAGLRLRSLRYRAGTREVLAEVIDPADERRVIIFTVYDTAVDSRAPGLVGATRSKTFDPAALPALAAIEGIVAAARAAAEGLIGAGDITTILVRGGEGGGGGRDGTPDAPTEIHIGVESARGLIDAVFDATGSLVSVGLA